jgi:hypothetical protein
MVQAATNRAGSRFPDSKKIFTMILKISAGLHELSVGQNLFNFPEWSCFF